MKTAIGLSGVLALLLQAASGDALASTDPVQADPNTGDNHNRYIYVGNNPYKFTDPDGRAKVCASTSCTITADTYNPARSNGQTAVASPELRTAADAAVPQFTVRSGSQESLGFFVPDADGRPVAQPAQGAQTTSNGLGSTAAAAIPQNAQGVIHGHIDGGRYQSNGLVDAPQLNRGYGDTQSLKAGIPTATVSQGQVGWHEINNGQVQFTYPEGAMNRNQERLIQRNLNIEQERFHIP